MKETTSSKEAIWSMRYGVLMEEFTKCFPDGSEMKEKAEEAVTMIIEAEMATEDVYVFLDSKFFEQQ